MNLNLTKSIAFFDLEATGLNVSADRIVEIGIIKINPDGSEEKLTQRVNPEIKIPAETTAIHGISDEDIADAPTFKALAKSVSDFIGDADLAGYNSNKFDIPMLLEEFVRAGIDFPMEGRRCVDVQNIFHKMEKRTLEAAYQFYCEKELKNAHSAEADIIATYEVLKAQLDKYGDLENDMDFLADFSQNSKHKVLDFTGRIALNENDEPIYNFGKHRNKTIQSILKSEPGYHAWMLNNDFPHYTKKVLREIVNKLNKANPPKPKKKQKPENFEDKLNQLKNKFS